MSKTKKKQFIWEYLLDNSDVHFEQARVWEPYEEIVEETQTEQGVCCKYNAMHRYEDIFMPYFLKNGIPTSEKDKVIFDVVSHYLAYEDMQSGMTYEEYRKRCFGEDIEQGMYGERVQEIYQELTVQERYVIMHYLDVQNRIRNADIHIYCNVMIRLLETGVIYKDCYHEKHYILYVGELRDTRREKMISLVNMLFLPLDVQVEVLWDKHFAVLGEYQTLQLDEIRIM